MIRRSLIPPVLTLVSLLAASAGRPVKADTVYLKNGSFINGVVLSRENSLILRIGNFGQLEIPHDEIYKIEKNKLTGAESAVTVEGRETDIEDVEDIGDDADDASDGDTAKDDNDAKDDAGSGGNPKEGDAKKDAGDSPASEQQGSSRGPTDGAASDVGKEDVDPELDEKITKLVSDLESTNPKFRIRAERELRSIGEPVVPYVVPLLRAEGELSRIAVARILTDVGDERAVDGLIEALLDTNEYVRDYANKALENITREDFGFRPNASPRRREAARLKWAKWWEQEIETRENDAKAQEGSSGDDEGAGTDRDDDR